MNFWKDLAERVLSSFAAAMLTFFAGDQINVWNLNWKLALGVSLGAAAVAALKGLVASHLGDGSPSLVNLAPPEPPVK